jgi:hypothetical protein
VIAGSSSSQTVANGGTRRVVERVGPDWADEGTSRPIAAGRQYGRTVRADVVETEDVPSHPRAKPQQPWIEESTSWASGKGVTPSGSKKVREAEDE